jgi:hypothetical protein
MKTLLARLIALSMALLVLVPAAASAKPKLYTISLTGDARKDVTDSYEAQPPQDCEGEGTVTENGFVSATFVPKLQKQQLSFKDGGFVAAFKNQRAEMTTTTTANFHPDAQHPEADCSVPPPFTQKCDQLTADSGNKRGADFHLTTSGGKIGFYRSFGAFFDPCSADSLGGSFLTVSTLGVRSFTSLKTSKVKSLKKGKSATAKGPIVVEKGQDDPSGPQVKTTLNIKLTFKRVK